MTALVQTGTPQRTRQWNAVIAASIGNALEWFDFVVYGFFAITIARLFFPAADEGTSLLVALATFGVTYFMRPLGAIVLGDYADRHGRKAAFSLTIVLMTLGTGIIALAPTYAAIGLWAPILIVLARCIQGFSAGGEFGAATAFLASSTRKDAASLPAGNSPGGGSQAKPRRSIPCFAPMPAIGSACSLPAPWVR